MNMSMNMNDLPVYGFIVVMIAMAAVLIMTLTTLSIADGDDVKLWVRDRLLRRLQPPRMAAMLHRRGIGRPEYLAQTPAHRIVTQARNCNHCSSQQACDDVLAQPATKAADYSFCPNDEAMQKIVDGRMESREYRRPAANH
jgi:hypothetical protein